MFCISTIPFPATSRLWFGGSVMFVAQPYYFQGDRDGPAIPREVVGNQMWVVLNCCAWPSRAQLWRLMGGCSLCKPNCEGCLRWQQQEASCIQEEQAQAGSKSTEVGSTPDSVQHQRQRQQQQRQPRQQQVQMQQQRHRQQQM